MHSQMAHDQMGCSHASQMLILPVMADPSVRQEHLAMLMLNATAMQNP